MHIDQLNIYNLTTLWGKYGAELVIHHDNSKLVASNSWPYRCWVEGEQNMRLQMSHTPKTHKLSSWSYPLPAEDKTVSPTSLDKNWHLEFEQTAMYLPLNKLTYSIEQQQSDVWLRRVDDYESLIQWLKISSEAFDYEIDQEVLKPLLVDNDIDIYLGCIKEQPVASAMLYKTGKATGLHQMGVKTDFQGQGIAKNVMHLLLSRALKQGSEYMVLQASKKGLPLYLQLGFQKQFKVLNYRFIESHQVLGK